MVNKAPVRYARALVRRGNVDTDTGARSHRHREGGNGRPRGESVFIIFLVTGIQYGIQSDLKKEFIWAHCSRVQLARKARGGI